MTLFEIVAYKADVSPTHAPLLSRLVYKYYSIRLPNRRALPSDRRLQSTHHLAAGCAPVRKQYFCSGYAHSARRPNHRLWVIDLQLKALGTMLSGQHAGLGTDDHLRLCDVDKLSIDPFATKSVRSNGFPHLSPVKVAITTITT